MRGGDVRTEGLFSYVSCEQRVPEDHPLRRVLPIVDTALTDLSPEFARLYAPIGRPSIPPEKLLRTLLLQAFYSVRSERQLMEQLDYNLLFRWFVGLGIEDPVWDVTVFTKNRDRLLDGDIAARFFQAVLNQPQVSALLSDEHFTVDGTLIEAWASMKSFRAKDGDVPPGRAGGRNAGRDFHGEQRSNATHASTTDPDARLIRRGRGKEAKLCHLGHLLMENHSGLIVDAMLTPATGTAERDAAEAMLGRQSGRHRVTLGADKAGACPWAGQRPDPRDAASFVARVRALNVTPHIAQNTARRSAIDGRTTRHPGYAVSQRVRKRIEEAFGWIKTTGGLRKTRHRGTDRVGWLFTLTAAACNLVRLPKLLQAG
ncbi:MAG: IS5 family transposase [Thermoleophilaceae bacterium]